MDLLGQVIGKMAVGVGNTLVNILEFSKAAAEGKAGIKDLLAAFKDLPFFLGDLFGIISQVAGVLERWVESWKKINDVGVSFAGSMTQMRLAATRTMLGLDEFVEKTRKFADILATAPGGIQAGVAKFVDIQSKLARPGGAYYDGMVGLGYSASEAADMLGIYMNMQGTLMKKNLSNNDTVAKGVFELSTQVDLYAKVLGRSRKEMEDSLAKVNLDATLETFIQNLGGKEQGRIKMLIADMGVTGAKGITEYLKMIIESGGEITGPITDEMKKLWTQTNGAIEPFLITMANAAKDTNITDEQFLRQREYAMRDMADQIARQHGIFGNVTQAALNATGDTTLQSQEMSRIMLRYAVKTNAQLEETLKEAKKRQDEEKKANEEAAKILKTQNYIKEMGNQILEKFIKALEPFIDPLVGLAVKLVDFITSVVFTTENMKRVSDLIGWITTFLTDVIDTFDKPDELMKVLDHYITEAVEAIFNIMSPLVTALWTALEPYMIAGWNKIVDRFAKWLIESEKQGGIVFKIRQWVDSIMGSIKGFLVGMLGALALSVGALVVGIFAGPVAGIIAAIVALIGGSLLPAIGAWLGWSDPDTQQPRSSEDFFGEFVRKNLTIPVPSSTNTSSSAPSAESQPPGQAATGNSGMISGMNYPIASYSGGENNSDNHLINLNSSMAQLIQINQHQLKVHKETVAAIKSLDNDLLSIA